jgi:hypothetical protein
MNPRSPVGRILLNRKNACKGLCYFALPNSFSVSAATFA